MNGLRPLALGELLDAAVSIYRARARTLLAAVAVPVVPVVIFQTLVTWSTQPDNYQPFDLSGQEPVDGGELALQMAGSMVGLAAIVLATSLATAACFRALSAAYVGGDVSWRESLAFARTRVWSVIGLSIVVGLATLVAAVACLVPVVLPLAFLSVATPVLLMEGLGVFAAWRRSIDLVRGRFWPVLGAVVVSSLLALVFQFIVQAPVLLLLGVDGTGLGFQVVNATLGAVAMIVVTPFTAAFTMALYVDLRVRKEGFDLYLWAQRVGSDAAGGFPDQPGAGPATWGPSGPIGPSGPRSSLPPPPGLGPAPSGSQLPPPPGFGPPRTPDPSVGDRGHDGDRTAGGDGPVS